MSAAVRLWWLLRSTSDRPRDAATAVSFALVTWCLLAGAGLVDLATRTPSADRALSWALDVLVVALGLTAVLCVRSMLIRGEDRRLAVLRSAGASRAQAAVVCGLDIADSALPGVLAGALTHVALWWLVSRAGAEVAFATPLFAVPTLLLVGAIAVVVAWRVRDAR